MDEKLLLKLERIEKNQRKASMNYLQKNKEKIYSYNREYYNKNKDEINMKKRLNRKLKLQQNTPSFSNE